MTLDAELQVERTGHQRRAIHDYRAGPPFTKTLGRIYMTRANKAFVGVVCGVVLMVVGIYGWFGENSILLSGVGLVVSLLAVGALLTTQSRATLTSPHPLIYVFVALALALHLYENLAKSSGLFSYGWLIWALVPYSLVLALSCFASTRTAVIAGAVMALVIDAWTHYGVFIEPKGSTAALALIWIPLWNTIIVIPLATFVARLIMRHRQSVASNAP
jgi:hypothetical protein